MRKIYSEEDYKNKCNELNDKFIGIHKDKHKGTIIEYICHKHESVGVQFTDWSHFKSFKNSCPYCSGRYQTTKDISEKLLAKHIQIMSEYTKADNKIKCKCLICEHVWDVLARDVTKYNKGCPVCGIKKAASKRRKSIDEFKKEMSFVNPNINIIGEYKNTHSKIKCKCKICGFIWDGYPANLLNKTAGCPKCHMSIGERNLLNALSSIGINYVPQYKLDGCEYKYKLRFDAYDVDNNIAFEYNGEQHYAPVNWGCYSEEQVMEEFKVTKLRDNIKKEYCLSHDIPLIIIPYWEKDNIEKYIRDRLKNIA